MMFPRFFRTGEMALYILENFERVQRGVAFPPLPLPDDYQGRCPDFDLIKAEEAARDFLLPEYPRLYFMDTS